MKPLSKEWTDREKAWAAECDRQYEQAAAKLIADGYDRQADECYPSVFVKDGETVILTRTLGTPGPWRTRPL